MALQYSDSHNLRDTFFSILVELMMVSIKANPSCFSDHILVFGSFKNMLLFQWLGIITFGSSKSLTEFLLLIITNSFLLGG